MEPCDTPACISLGVDISPSTEVLNFLSECKELISLIMLSEKFYFSNIHKKRGCHDISKAFSISKNTAAVERLYLKFKVTWALSRMH